MADSVEKCRSLSSYEKSVILRLLEPDFPGRNELLKQVENCSCASEDFGDALIIILKVIVGEPAVVQVRIPTEALGDDKDGKEISFLLHVVDGYLDELEIYKLDGSNIQALPAPSDLRLLLETGHF